MTRLVAIVTLGLACCGMKPEATSSSKGPATAAPAAATPAPAPPAADSAARILSCPPGSADVACSTVVSPDRVALCVRESANALHSAWYLDLRSGAWTRVTDARFKYPLAIGARGEGALLVIPGTPGALKGELLASGKPSVEVPMPPGMPRAAQPSLDGDCWWLGGAFRSDDGYQISTLACPTEAPVHRSLPGPKLPWFGGPGTEFTGLIVRAHELLVSSVGSCTVDRWSVDSGAVTVGARIDAEDPDFLLACKLDAAPADADGTGAWRLAVDMPMGLLDLGESYMVMIRRAHRGGWTLLELDLAGQRRGRIDLPWESIPLAATSHWILTTRADLDVPGQPSHLEIHETASLRRGIGSPTPFGGHEIERTVRLVTDWATPTGLAALPVILVDGRRCPGDVVRDIAGARSAGKLTSRAYRLAVSDAPTQASILNLGSVVGRDLSLDAVLLEWRAPPPKAAVLLGGTIRLLE